ncbi:MAG: hypothetical protein K2M80_04720, partial [Muribaculaceae bacterium]|nr:hypothetical protein [Muribaculaceae bacterium]
GLEKTTVQNSPASMRLKAADIKLASASIKGMEDLTGGDDDDPAGDETTYTSLGKGTWIEGPLDLFTDIAAGVTHEVEIWQSDQDPNIYRILPYGEGSPLAEAFGRVNEAYFYVNVTDPNAVLGYGDEDGDVIFFNAFYISQYVSETGWNGGNGYGTFDADTKCISFPAKSFCINYNNQWHQTNTEGKFKIYLPGADVKDYSFDSYADVCNAENKIRFIAQGGADIANLKLVITKGSLPASADNLAYVAENGQDMESGKTYSFTNDEAGVFSIIIAAVDAAGNVQDGAAHWCHILNDDADNWKSFGKAKFIDPLLYSADYLEEMPDAVDVEIEQNIADPNQLRIVNPYSGHEDGIAHDDHGHHIYIDVTDPERVRVKLSLTGFDGGYGHMSVWSAAARYTNSTEELLQYGYVVPTYDDETATISLPAKSIMTAEPDYNHNAFYYTVEDGKLELPHPVGVSAVIADGDISKAEFYNLQGVRVVEPSNGLYIVRQGSKATKQVVK